MKLAIFILIVSASILHVQGLGHNYERRYSPSARNDLGRLSSQPIVVDATEKPEKNESSGSSSSSEESAETTTTTRRPRSNYRRRQRERPETRSLDENQDGRRYRGRAHMERGYPIHHIVTPSTMPQPDTEPEQLPINPDAGKNRLHHRGEGLVQYGNENRWTIFRRNKPEDGTEGEMEELVEATTAKHEEDHQQGNSRHGLRRPHLRRRDPVPRRQLKSLDAPRLDLKSGDNVQFSDGVSWTIERSADGLTRVGTRDGEVVVRIFRPYRKNHHHRKHPDQKKPEHNLKTPPEYDAKKCQMGQDCYVKWVNYQNYGFHLEDLE